jgi:hypothetical protein
MIKTHALRVCPYIELRRTMSTQQTMSEDKAAEVRRLRYISSGALSHMYFYVLTVSIEGSIVQRALLSASCFRLITTLHIRCIQKILVHPLVVLPCILPFRLSQLRI